MAGKHTSGILLSLSPSQYWDIVLPFPNFKVHAGDLNSCLCSKHFRYRAISSALQLFVIAWNEYWIHVMACISTSVSILPHCLAVLLGIEFLNPCSLVTSSLHVSGSDWADFHWSGIQHHWPVTLEPRKTQVYRTVYVYALGSASKIKRVLSG